MGTMFLYCCEEATTGEGSEIFLPLIDTGYGDTSDLIEMLGNGLESGDG